MNNKLGLIAAAALAANLAWLGGCAIAKPDAKPALYDLGLQPSSAALPVPPPIIVAGIAAPGWIDSTAMYYRFDYANGQQPRPYAQARWTMTPAQLLLQRLKTRIAQAGGVVLQPSDGVAGLPLLRIEMDDFTQHFTAPAQSAGRVSLRATVFRGRALVAQKTFTHEAPAPGADAEGGVQALTAAADVAIADIIGWLATLPLK